MDSAIHIAVVSREGRPILLADPAAPAAFSAEMGQTAARTGLQAFAGFPYRVGGVLRGAISFAWDHPRGFDSTDTDVLQALAVQYGQAVARIEARQVEQAQMRQAVQMSEALQGSLLGAPQSLPGLTVHARYRAAADLAQIGGDWFDSHTTAGGVLHVVVGDVSGHDQDAAALMGQARNVLRGIVQVLDAAPAELVQRLDQALADLGASLYATVVMASLHPDPAGGATLRWTNAGHPAPLVLRGRSVEVLHTSPEVMLGVDAAAPVTTTRPTWLRGTPWSCTPTASSNGAEPTWTPASGGWPTPLPSTSLPAELPPISTITCSVSWTAKQRTTSSSSPPRESDTTDYRRAHPPSPIAYDKTDRDPGRTRPRIDRD